MLPVRLRVALLPLLPALVAGLLACASSSRPPQPRAQESSAVTDAPPGVAAEPGPRFRESSRAGSRAAPRDSPSVTILLDPGAEPHALLRYNPRVGDQVRWTTIMAMDTSISLLGQSSRTGSTIELLSKTELVAIDERTRDQDYRSTFVGARALGEASDAAAVEAALAPYLDLELWSRSNARGEALEFHYTRNGALVDPSDLPGLDSVVAVLVFPEEAVGIGARWRRYTEAERGGFRILQTNDHRLVRREGDEIEIEITVAQEPLSTTMRTSNMAEGTHAELQRFESTGSNRSTHDLGFPVPLRSRTQAEIIMEALIVTGEEQVEMTLELRVSTEISRRD